MYIVFGHRDEFGDSVSHRAGTENGNGFYFSRFHELVSTFAVFGSGLPAADDPHQFVIRLDSCRVIDFSDDFAPLDDVESVDDALHMAQL